VQKLLRDARLRERAAKEMEELKKRGYGMRKAIFLLPVHGEKVPEGRMRGSAMRGENRIRTLRARELRHIENDAEDKLWSELRGRRLNGHKFVTQLRIGPYYADFACRESNLVVEVDGSQHADSPRDAFRNETMIRNGWSVLRFWHIDVLQNRRQVCETILAALDGRLAKRTEAVDLKFYPAENFETRR
jgi:very-short-patch-repair endonuclease